MARRRRHRRKWSDEEKRAIIAQTQVAAQAETILKADPFSGHLFVFRGRRGDLIRDRTRAGLAAAAARGRKGGRARVLDDAKLRSAHALIAKRLTVRETAARHKIGKSTLYDAIRQGGGAADRQPEI